jgi:acetyl esterase/lipase
VSLYQFTVHVFLVVFLGDSAGGNFAAAISLLLRDEKFPVMPKLQVLIYPAVQFFDFATPSYQANKDGPLLVARHVGEFKGLYIQGHSRNADDYIKNRHVTKAVVDEMRRKYLPLAALPDDDLKKNHVHVESPVESALWEEIKDAVLSPYVSPLVAETLDGMPFAYILACNHDVLRDDAIWFAERMGANARLDVMNCFHGCMNFCEDLESVAQIMKQMNDFIREYL